MLRAGEATPALEKLEKALADDPLLYAAHMNKASLLAQLTRFEEALTVADDMIALEPGQPEAYILRGVFFENLDREDEAQTDYARALDRYETLAGEKTLAPEAQVNRAVTVFLLDGSIDGLRAINEVIETYPDFGSAQAVKERMLEGKRSEFLLWVREPRLNEAVPGKGKNPSARDSTPVADEHQVGKK